MAEDLGTWKQDFFDFLPSRLREPSFLTRAKAVDARFGRVLKKHLTWVVRRKERESRIEELLTAKGLLLYQKLHSNLVMSLEKISQCTAKNGEPMAS